MKIDAHQHFWKYDPIREAWISNEMEKIRKDFLPADLLTELLEKGIKGTVLVQADQSEAENDLMLAWAADYDFIKGVVGWVDLQSPTVEERLNFYSELRLIKGFRHVLQSEEQRDVMLTRRFVEGISALKAFEYTFDLLVNPDQLIYCNRLVSSFPNQLFVLDHLAKPDIRGGQIDEWQAQIRAIAENKNLYCKVSGMVTEADWQHWKQEDFIPFLDTIVAAFGTERLMFGSDWPVCLVAATYGEVTTIAENYFRNFSASEQSGIFGNNAALFYNLAD